MSYKYGPSIVTDGLVFYVDAANSKSYPGTGTTWSDLVGESNSTLANGPTYSSLNGGYISFDGVDDHSRNTDDSLLLSSNDITICMWLRIKGAGDASFNRFIDIRPNGTGNQIYLFWDEDDLRYGFGNATSFTSAMVTGADPTLNTWQYWVGVHDYTNSTTKFYVNNQVEASGTDVTTLSNSSYSIAIRQDIGADQAYIDVSNVKIYNRALSASEILQNYNALKNRFV